MNIRPLYLIALFVCLTGCQNELKEKMASSPNEKASIESFLVDEPYTFQKLQDPNIWRTFKNMEEMIDACQIPEDILRHISTENLIVSCMNYPLFFTYSAYNNELDGIKIIIENFNGLIELQKRNLAAEKLIDFYSIMDIETSDLKYNTLHLGYIELLLTSGIIQDIFNAKNIEKLEEAASLKLYKKLSRPDVYSIFSVNKSLLLGASIALQKGASITEKGKELLENFINCGGMVESSQYTEVSRLINL